MSSKMKWPIKLGQLWIRICPPCFKVFLFLLLKNVVCTFADHDISILLDVSTHKKNANGYDVYLQTKLD